MRLDSKKYRDLHTRALTEFDTIQSALREERLQCLKDRRFYSIAGAQWEGELGEQFANKPRFEVNKIHLAVIRIINEYRNNRISVSFIPKNGTKDDKLADTCNDLYRADEQDSSAEEAFDNGFEEAVGGGMGAWRLRTVCEDEDEEDKDCQRVRIEPIYDADSSVFFNLDSKRQDKADAKRCYVISSMSIAAYEEEYGESPSSWEKSIHQFEFDWLTPDVVYIAEFYEVEKVKETIHIFKGLDEDELFVSEQEFKDDETKLDVLTATGFVKVDEKTKKTRKVHKYILSGNGVLEDCGYIAGKNIPIVVVYGKRWFVDNVERCMGHVRLAKDAQRLKNMQLSKLGELSALSSTEKPIFTPEQMAGHGAMWAADNVKNYPYMLLNPSFDQNGQPVAMGPLGYTKPPAIPPAMAALLQITETDIQDLLGNQQAGEQLQPQMSGIAVELIQNKLDMQTFIYISNQAKAVKRTGDIWLSMQKDIAVKPGRKMKTLNAAGEVSNVELMKPVINSKTGEQEFENDLSIAEFDATVEVGPTSSSKRGATVRGLTGMMQITQDPETLQVLGAMTMLNMEGEGIGEVRDYFRNKLIRMGVVKPTKEEEAELQAEAQNQKPDANEQFLQASSAKAQADAERAKAETLFTAAKTDKTKVETAKALTEIKQGETRHILQTAQALDAGLNAPITPQ